MTDLSLLYAAADLAKSASTHYQRVMDETRISGLTKAAKARRTLAKGEADKAEARFQMMLETFGLDRLP